jgi:ferritin-like metal-binding protein YciE
MKTNGKNNTASRIGESGADRKAGNGNGKAKGSNGNGKTANDHEETGGTDHGMLARFFEDELKDLYWAEKHLVKELGKMAAKATSPELCTAFTNHQAETEEHVARLESVFEILGKKPVAKKCEAISGIAKEVADLIRETEDDTFTRDVALIVGAQKAEHYEIATYGSLAQIARTMGKINVAAILEKTLKEERNADSVLTYIAESYVNEDATAEPESARK